MTDTITRIATIGIDLGDKQSHYACVDETGTVIDQFGPQYSEFDLPIVDGLVSPGGGGTQGAIDPARVELAARVIAELIVSSPPDSLRSSFVALRGGQKIL